jgi:hypothetical protein
MMIIKEKHNNQYKKWMHDFSGKYEEKFFE